MQEFSYFFHFFLQLFANIRFFLYLCTLFYDTTIGRMNSYRKYLLLLLLATTAVGMHAQSAKTTDKHPIPMRVSLIINAGICDTRPPALGFTLMHAGQFGYYGNFMISAGTMHLKSDYHSALDGSLTDGEYAGVIPFYSGKRAYNRFSGTLGAVCRMGIPLYAYLGAGYGYKNETRELLNRQWTQTANSLGHSGIVEAGLIGHLQNFTLQAGYTLFIGQNNRLFHEAKVGIGFKFDK